MSLSYQGRAPVLRDEEDPNRRLMLVHEHNPGGMQRTAERVTTNTTVYYGDKVSLRIRRMSAASLFKNTLP